MNYETALFLSLSGRFPESLPHLIEKEKEHSHQENAALKRKIKVQIVRRQ